jgi:hypothetical protein
VAIQALLEGGVFGPDDIAAMTAAFESTLRALQLTNRKDDPAVISIARLTIEVARDGERDPESLTEAILKRTI